MKKFEFNNASKCMALTSVLFSCGMATTNNEGGKTRENDRSLAAEWRDDCRKADWLGTSFHKEVLVFSLIGDYRRTISTYEKEDCATADLTIEVAGTFQALGDSATAGNSKDINFSTTTATLKPESDSSTKFLNDSKYCSISNWETGKQSDILNLDCLAISHAKGEVVFDIYRLSDSKKDLSFGKETFWLDKTKADQRPASINEAHMFHRQ